MTLTKLQFKPGINRDITSYSNEGGYFDGDLIRFNLGFPEKVGGWVKYSPNTYLGNVKVVSTNGSNVAVPPRDDAQGNGGFQAAGQPQKVEDDLPF